MSVRPFFQLFEPKMLVSEVALVGRETRYSPPFVRFAFSVSDQARLGLEPLCALDAVVPTKARQVLSGLGLLVQLQVPWRREVGLNLIKIANGNISNDA